MVRAAEPCKRGKTFGGREGLLLERITIKGHSWEEET